MHTHNNTPSPAQLAAAPSEPPAAGWPWTGCCLGLGVHLQQPVYVCVCVCVLVVFTCSVKSEACKSSEGVFNIASVQELLMHDIHTKGWPELYIYGAYTIFLAGKLPEGVT